MNLIYAKFRPESDLIRVNFIKGEAVDTDKFLSEIWGELKLFLDPKTQILADERSLAVLLAVGADNFDRFMALKAF